MTESSKPQAQYLKDYKAPDFLIDHTELTFDLQPLSTKVSSLLKSWFFSKKSTWQRSNSAAFGGNRSKMDFRAFM